MELPLASADSHVVEPSDLWTSRLGIELRERLGIETLLWASDYPHSDSTWPHSQSVVERGAFQRTRCAGWSSRTPVELYGLRP